MDERRTIKCKQNYCESNSVTNESIWPQRLMSPVIAFDDRVGRNLSFCLILLVPFLCVLVFASVLHAWAVLPIFEATNTSVEYSRIANIRIHNLEHKLDRRLWLAFLRNSHMRYDQKKLLFHFDNHQNSINPRICQQPESLHYSLQTRYCPFWAHHRVASWRFIVYK